MQLNKCFRPESRKEKETAFISLFFAIMLGGSLSTVMRHIFAQPILVATLITIAVLSIAMPLSYILFFGIVSKLRK